MSGNDKKIIAIVAIALGAGLVLGSLISSPQVQANGFTDFFGKIFAPLKPKLGGNAQTSSSVSLYQPTVDYEQSVVNAVKTSSPAVVSIVISENVPVIANCPYNPFENLPPEFQQFFGNGGSGMSQPCDTGKTQLQEVGGGSGFIISSDGLILTNKHVVSDAKASYTVITNDGTKYDAKVLARDQNQDLAVVKINATGLPTVTLGDSESLELGQTTIAIGNALGQFSNTVSVGVVSGLARTVTASSENTGAQETIRGVIQTDAAINPGNSGGPLLNLRGEVVGVNTAIASGAQSIGFAIPINRVKNDIASVKSTGQISSPYLGVRYLIISTDIAKSQNLSVGQGALVRGDTSGPAVTPGSPAAQAGILAEDIILKVDGVQIDATHDLAGIVAEHAVGDKIMLTVNRGGKEITLQVSLGKRPTS